MDTPGQEWRRLFEHDCPVADVLTHDVVVHVHDTSVWGDAQDHATTNADELVL
jgi:hypothetical protein